MDAAGAWHLHLLGEFRLLHSTRQLHLATRKAASLLAFLAMHPGRHSREELATLLWGNYPDSDARPSLRTALSELRAALGDGAIMADREAVQLNPAFPLWVDALVFEAQAQRALAAPDEDIAASPADLYGGDLLPDFDHEWLVPERERLRGLRLDVLLRLAQAYRSRAEYDHAIETAERVLAVEPSNERAHQHLMFCRMVRGDRSAALQQYEACRRALQDDLGVEPLPETERLCAWIKGQPEHAPALEARISNLPAPVTSFIGRKQELAGCLELLRRPDVRLLSVTGAGGTGKTRLALEAASALLPEYAHGVFFIDLAALRQADLLPSAIARPIGVQPAQRQSLSQALFDFLREKHMLLLLDNFEQIIEAGPLLVELLKVAPKLKLMVTSRAALRLTAEQEYPLLPLQTPDMRRLPDLPTLSQYEAVALFVARSRAVQPDFQVSNANAPAVAEICVRLDGLPLAIELAAARSRILSPHDMLEQLEHRLDLLSDGAHDLPSRHRTLRSAIDWSYALLSADEQRLFRHLAVFVGGWTLEAARAVCGGDVLAGQSALVQNSMARRVEQADGGMRFSMLETIREYALERLGEDGQGEAARTAHAAFFLAYAEEVEPRLHGPDQRYWLDVMETEHNNLRAVLQWAIERGEAEVGLRLATAASTFFIRRNHAQEALSWFLPLLALPAGAGRTIVRGRALFCAVETAGAHMSGEQRLRLAEESVSICRELGDAQSLACALYVLGETGMAPLDRQRVLFQESLALFREANDIWKISDTLHDLGDIAWITDNDLGAARAYYEEAIERLRTCGDKRRIAMVLSRLMTVCGVCGDMARKRALGQEALALADELGDRVARMRVLGAAAGGQSDSEQIRMMDEALAIAREVGDRHATQLYMSWAAEARMFAGDYDGAELLVHDVLALSRQIGSGRPMALLDAASLALFRGQAERARPLLRESLTLSLTQSGGPNVRLVFYTVLWLAVHAAYAGHWQRSARLAGAVDAYLTPTGSLEPGLRLPFEKSQVATKEHLGEEAYAQVLAAGRAMTIVEAAEYWMSGHE